ncbi:MAG: aspartate aminotransferase family protein [Pseudomonadota bacterium]|nr:aspartate aminotransferase family protein [Pseudomonadota bacterium]
MVTAVMPTYGRIDIAFESGEGSYLYDTEGEKYLDFATGIATNSLGHCHPHLVASVQEQASKLWHVSNLYNIPEQQRFADRLVENSFADTVFFCNSGAEAMEGCLKVARKYHFENGEPEREEIVCATGAFHGRTLTTLSAGDSEKYREGFGPRPEGFHHVAFGNLNEMRAAMSTKTAAILVEPIQGEGGINPASTAYLRALRDIADEFNALLIFDEVQCGMGRAGKLFAYELANVTPDIMGLAKGIGGGFPVGAVLATEKAASGMVPGTHGSTYGGNPLAMAAANAVLDVINEPDFLSSIIKKGNKLKDDLTSLVDKHPSVLESVRGVGLMLGVKSIGPNLELMTALRENKLLTVVAGENVVRILPPLNVSEDELDEAVQKIDQVCNKITG